MTVSEIVRNLKRELAALKQTFRKSATSIPLYTKTLSYATSKNACRQVYSGTGFDYEDNERVVVTLNTSEGANTLAKLEIDGDYDIPPIIRRVPYSGGARWVVANAPRYSSGGWAPTHYNFTVQTLVNGTLAAKMIWET